MKTKILIALLLTVSLLSCKKDNPSPDPKPQTGEGPLNGSHWIWQYYTAANDAPEVLNPVETHWIARDSTVSGIVGLALYTNNIYPNQDPLQGMVCTLFIYKQNDDTWRMKHLTNASHNAPNDAWLTFPSNTLPDYTYNLCSGVMVELPYDYKCVMVDGTTNEYEAFSVHKIWQMQYHETNTTGGEFTILNTFGKTGALLVKQTKSIKFPNNTKEKREYRLKTFTR